MRVEASLKCSFTQEGHRYFLNLQAIDSNWEWIIPCLSGTSNHLLGEHLRGVDWSAWERAYDHVGIVQPLRTIDLSEYDLAHLTQYVSRKS